MNNDIICAIATPLGEGGVSIIRLSGVGVVDLVDKFTSYNTLKKEDYNTINFDKFLIKDEVFDEVLLSKFRENKSYTGEEIVEINCHGGMFVTKEILNFLIKQPEIRLAEPGEFTKRAFLNGKMSLNKAQGVMDIITAHNKSSHTLALRAFSNDNIEILEYYYKELLQNLSSLSVGIDYPEYRDIEDANYNELLKFINEFSNKTSEIIKNTERGLLLKNGIDTVIIGQPNVGKSTLLNLLSKKQKAIVTDIAGTTRDIIEAEVLLGDLKLNLKDTAGIRKTSDVVEKIGVELSIDSIKDAQLVIFITDSTKAINDKDVEIFELLKDKKHIILNNKVDLGGNKQFPNSIDVSLTSEGIIKVLEKEIIKTFNLSSFDVDNSHYLNNSKQQMLLEEILEILNTIHTSLEFGEPIDLIEIDLKEVLFLLGDILGKQAKNDIINEMFSNFCLGK